MPYATGKERHDQEPHRVAADHQPSTVDPVGQGTADDGEERERSDLADQRGSGRERGVREMEGEQRNGKRAQTVADIAERLSDEELPESRRGKDGSGRTIAGRGHRRTRVPHLRMRRQG